MIYDLQIFDTRFDANDFCVTHLCSACWGILQSERVENGKTFTAICENCQEKTIGYVTKKYVERRVRDNQLEAMNAKWCLKDAIPWMFPGGKKTQDEILKSLGF